MTTLSSSSSSNVAAVPNTFLLDRNTSSNNNINSNIHLRFRRVVPTDIPRCLELEQASYPADEAASKSALQYRQHHAAPYFRCAVLRLMSSSSRKKNKNQTTNTNTITAITTLTTDTNEGIGAAASPAINTTNNNNSTNLDVINDIMDDDIDDDPDSKTWILVGFICGTRCNEFGAATMKPGSHHPNGTLLAIHSVVVDPQYRRLGIGKAMMQDYIQQISMIVASTTTSTATQTTTSMSGTVSSSSSTSSNQSSSATTTPCGLSDYYDYYSEPRIEKFVLLSKQMFLSFYLACGFSVLRASDITHGSDVWYHCEHTISPRYPNVKYWVVDSFATKSQPGSGNPAAIVLLLDSTTSITTMEPSSSSQATLQTNHIDNINSNPPPRSKEWMQLVAREFNLSETAFCWPRIANPATLQQQSSSLLAAAPPFDTLDSVNNNTTTTNYLSEWNILYFTPQVEVALCGHATLAAGHVIASTILKSEQSRQQPSQDFHTTTTTGAAGTTLVFHATNDVLKTTVVMDGVYDSIVTMDFPSLPPQPCIDASERLALTQMMERAFHIPPNDILYMGISPDLGDVLIEITQDGFFQIGYGSALNLSALQRKQRQDNDNTGILLPAGYTRGVILCCSEPRPAVEPDDNHEGGDDDDNVDDDVGPSRKNGGMNTAGTTTTTTTASTTNKNNHTSTQSNAGSSSSLTVDFWSRFFAPMAGIDEDPVTGSAHCVLAPYFGKVLNKSRVIGKQMSLRTGVVECNNVMSLSSSKDPQQQQNMSSSSSMVQITGTAVTMMQGTLRF